MYFKIRIYMYTHNRHKGVIAHTNVFQSLICAWATDFIRLIWETAHETCNINTCSSWVFVVVFLILTVLISIAGLEGVVSSEELEVSINLSRYASIVFDTLYNWQLKMLPTAPPPPHPSPPSIHTTLCHSSWWIWMCKSPYSSQSKYNYSDLDV